MNRSLTTKAKRGLCLQARKECQSAIRAFEELHGAPEPKDEMSDAEKERLLEHANLLWLVHAHHVSMCALLAVAYSLYDCA